MAADMRLRYFALDALYFRSDDWWNIIVSPSRPETPGLDFDGQQMFLDATEIIIPVTQPVECLQLIQGGQVVFTPQVGDLIHFRIGSITSEYKVVERGDRPCWCFLFGNREIQVFVEKLRL